MTRPALASASHADDAARMARFTLLAPGLTPGRATWTRDMRQALCAVADELAEEAAMLSRFEALRRG